MKIIKFVFSWSTLDLFCYSLSLLMCFVTSQFLLDIEFATICVLDVSHIPLLKDGVFAMLVTSLVGLTVSGFSILSKLSKSSGKVPAKSQEEKDGQL